MNQASQNSALLSHTLMEKGQDSSVVVEKEMIVSHLLDMLKGDEVRANTTESLSMSRLQQKAKELWEEAAASGFADWSKVMKEGSKSDLKKRREAGPWV
jgi:hypothetical protein